VKPVTLTSAQLAQSLGRGVGFVEAIMAESEAQGIVEKVGPHSWRLTDRGFEIVRGLVEPTDV
jgi:hypothetical protein